MRKPPRKTRETHLMAYWNDKEDDVEFNWPFGSQTKCDSHLLYGVLSMKQLEVVTTSDFCRHRYAEKSFLEELDARGYDLTTLKFSIKLKPGARQVETKPPKEPS